MTDAREVVPLPPEAENVPARQIFESLRPGEIVSQGL